MSTPAPRPREPWLTVDEVAEILKLHPQTVRDLIRRGTLRAHRFTAGAGQRFIVRINPRDLEALGLPENDRGR